MDKKTEYPCVATNGKITVLFTEPHFGIIIDFDKEWDSHLRKMGANGHRFLQTIYTEYDGTDYKLVKDSND